MIGVAFPKRVLFAGQFLHRRRQFFEAFLKTPMRRALTAGLEACQREYLLALRRGPAATAHRQQSQRQLDSGNFTPFS